MDLLREVRASYVQTEAYLALLHHLRPRLPLPPMRGWAISPDFGRLLLRLTLRHQPRAILECGGGTSTLLLAYALERLGQLPQGQIVSLDHEACFAQATRDELDAHGLSSYARVIHAPLKPLSLEGRAWAWYDCGAVPPPPAQGYDLLLIDGPTQHGNPEPMVRYPALPVCYAALAEGALILLDDAARHDEAQAAERWLSSFALEELPTWDTEKGARLFRKSVGVGSANA